MRIGFDFDGVLCKTPFGRLAVHAPSPVPDLPADYTSLYGVEPPGGPLRLIIEYARFAWRRADPEAEAVLRSLAGPHELHIVTGRSVGGADLMRRWLRRRGLEGYVASVRMAPPGLKPAQHKLATAKMIPIDAHVDDDPRTAYHLAANGVRTYLFDHAGAHGNAPLPPRLSLVRSLKQFAAEVVKAEGAGGPSEAP